MAKQANAKSWGLYTHGDGSRRSYPSNMTANLAVLDATERLAASAAALGSLADDQPYSISNGGIYDFGTPPAYSTEWQGGATLAARALDTAFDSFMDARWTQFVASQKWRTSTTYACPARGRCLLWDSTDPRSGFGSATAGNWGQASHIFNPGVAEMARYYVSRLAYMDIPASPGTQVAQLKNIRAISQYTAEGASGVSDAEMPNYYFTHSPANVGLIAGNNNTIQPPYNIGGTIWFEDTYVNWNPNVGTEINHNRVWVMQEFMAIHGTPGSLDATLEYRARRLSDGVLLSNHRWSPMNLLAAGETRRYKYLNFQNGFFNGDLSSPFVNEWASSKFAQMDLFIGINTVGRVMLGDASTFAACTKFAAQPYGVGDWSSSSITIPKANQGIHANMSGKYSYVFHCNTGALVNTTGIPA